ncbi:MAG TPA: outer membrane beta-barrel protein [Polyangiales bacterium]
MSMRTLGALVVTAACALASPALAQDQETGAVSVSASASGPRASSSRYRSANPGRIRINAGLHFGGGGEWHLDPEGPAGDLEADLDPHVGIQAGAEYILMKYFALGGELRLTWWKPDDDELIGGDVDRSMFFDLNIKPRGRYEFDRFPLEVYGTLPMGLSIAAMNDDTGLDTGAGFNLGFGGGATYFLTSMFGLNAELLGVWHWFDADTDATDVDTDNRVAQFYFLLNAVIAL